MFVSYQGKTLSGMCSLSLQVQRSEGLEDGPADTSAVVAYLFSRFALLPFYGSSVLLWRERLVERSQKVHGGAKAGDDPADMDVGSRPLTMDGNWPGRSLEA